MTFLQAIAEIVSSGLILHLSYIIMIYLLFIEKRKLHLMLDRSLEKNLKMGDQLDGMRNELKALHIELIKLNKDNHLLSHEIQLLLIQINALRAQVTKN